MSIRLLLICFWIGIIFFASSCSSAKKAYERGDYYGAVLKSVNRLRKNPDHRKSREILRKSYPLAVEDLESYADHQVVSNAPEKWKNVANAYEKINHMYEEIKAAPGARMVIKNPKNYYAKLKDVKQKAAAESYAAGAREMERGTRESAKQAYYLFVRAHHFVPGYLDVENKIEEALYLATLKVVVQQIPVPGRYALSSGFFQDKVEAFLHSKYKGSHFVRFYSPREAERENLDIIDQYLKLSFDDFAVGETHIYEKEETISRDSVKVGEVKLESGETVPAFNTVKAKLKIHKKVIISKGLLSMRIVDANTGAVFSHKKFPGEFTWYTEWGAFNGDERALTEEQLALCNKEDVPPPSPQVLFIEFTKPIYSQLTIACRNFYKRY